MWGGFIDLESLYGPDSPNNFPGQENRFDFAYGRNSLAYILQTEKPEAVYLPYYICDSVVHTIQQLTIEIKWYGIERDFAPTLPEIQPNEMVLVVNYFGTLSDSTINSLADRLKHHLILDLTHAWFQTPPASVWAFNSTRKFFGVPDGSILWAPHPLPAELHWEENTPEYKHLIERSLGKPNEAYQLYTRYEASIPHSIRQQSGLSKRILRHTKLHWVAERRQQNYQQLHEALAPFNQLQLPPNSLTTPFAYPFLPIKPILHGTLHGQGIFVPQLWKEVLQRDIPDSAFEKTLAKSLLPLPLDQRYDSSHIEGLINQIKPFLL